MSHLIIRPILASIIDSTLDLTNVVACVVVSFDHVGVGFTEEV